jgi:hypothetical protein
MNAIYIALAHRPCELRRRVADTGRIDRDRVAPPRAPAARHRRVPRSAFSRESLYGVAASGPAHSVLAHRAHAERNAPAARSSLATKFISSSCRSRCSGRGITSWRSAANAPDGYQIEYMMVGAFVSCNGVLASCDGELHE